METKLGFLPNLNVSTHDFLDEPITLEERKKATCHRGHDTRWGQGPEKVSLRPAGSMWVLDCVAKIAQHESR